MTMLKVSLGQMDVKLGGPQENLAVVAHFAAQAAGQGADVLVLPELWSTGYDLENAADYAADLDDGVFAETAVLARQHNLHIIGSCLSKMSEGKFGNTAVRRTIPIFKDRRPTVYTQPISPHEPNKDTA